MYSIDGSKPKINVLPNDVQELSHTMATAWQDDLAVAPWGGGTRVELGNTPDRLDMVVDLSRLNKIVRHYPADLTATVEAGTTFTTLQETLAEHGQFLALDPPLPHYATVGGTLATGVSGPLKWRSGTPRDLVIGMKVVQATGKLTKSGGQVVKNVSGYDMARLHVGGLGTLGIIAEVSFKLTPLPRKETTLVATFETVQQCLDAGLSIFHSHVMPLALTHFDSVVNRISNATRLDGSHFLAIRLVGKPLTLERQVRESGSLCRENGTKTVETLGQEDAVILWRRLADFGWEEDTTPVIAGRISILPSNVPLLSANLETSESTGGLYPAIISHPGHGTILVHWFADRPEVSNHTASEILVNTLESVHGLGGRMVTERCPLKVKGKFDVWDDVGEALEIMRRMKEQYDPKRILNPGRFAGGI